MYRFIIITGHIKYNKILKLRDKNEKGKKENICNIKNELKNNVLSLYVCHSFDSNLSKTQHKDLVSYIFH